MTEICNHYNTEREHLETGEIPQRRQHEEIKAGKSPCRLLQRKISFELTLNLYYPRTVKKDGAFSFRGKLFKLKHLSGERVTVAIIPSQKLSVLKNKQKVTEFSFKFLPLTSTFDFYKMSVFDFHRTTG